MYIICNFYLKDKKKNVREKLNDIVQGQTPETVYRVHRLLVISITVKHQYFATS